MTVPRSLVLEQQESMTQLRGEALADAERLIESVWAAPVEDQQALLMDLLPPLGESYTTAAGLFSEEYFREFMRFQGLSGAAVAAPPLDRGVWYALAGWAWAHRQEIATSAAMLSLVGGGLTRRMTQVSASTVMNSAAANGMRYQRVAAPGCCAFCGMLASRGASYTSRASAGVVVGRGKPVESNIRGYAADGSPLFKRGGQARGVNPRGKRALGEAFHDHCRCQVVAIDAGNAVEMQETAGDYLDSYLAAANEVRANKRLVTTTYKSSDGSLKNRYRWEHSETGASMGPDETTSMILQAMRADLGVK